MEFTHIYYLCFYISHYIIELEPYKKNKILSVIIPLYNEEKSVTIVLEMIAKVQLPYGIGKEIIIIDDASSDNSRQVVEDYIHNHPAMNIHAIFHSRNSGKGSAIRSGIEFVSGDYVIIQDADLEYDPKDYATLLKCMIDENRKVVYGSRFLKKENKHSYQSFYWGGRLVSFITNILYGQRLTDEPTCYKLFEASLIRDMYLECERFEFCPEITAKVSRLGYKIKELPVNYYPRSIEDGKKITWIDGVEAIWVLIVYRFKNIRNFRK